MNVKTSPYFSLHFVSTFKYLDYSTQFSDLCLTIEKEFKRVDSVSDGATNDRKPVEYYRRSVRGFQQDLLKDRGDDDDYRKRKSIKKCRKSVMWKRIADRNHSDGNPTLILPIYIIT